MRYLRVTPSTLARSLSFSTLGSAWVRGCVGLCCFVSCDGIFNSIYFKHDAALLRCSCGIWIRVRMRTSVRLYFEAHLTKFCSETTRKVHRIVPLCLSHLPECWILKKIIVSWFYLGISGGSMYYSHSKKRTFCSRTQYSPVTSSRIPKITKPCSLEVRRCHFLYVGTKQNFSCLQVLCKRQDVEMYSR
jgi:hypothetical protein